MDYAGRRADDPAAAAAAPHHAAYAAAHHLPTTNPNPTPLHQHPYHLNHNPQIQSHYSQYYPNPNPSSAPSYPSSNPSSAPTYPSSNPSSAAGPNFDGNPTAAAPPGAEPYLPNPYHGGYEGLRRAAATAADGPPAVDPHMPDPYAAHRGYGGLPAAARAADGPPTSDPYAAYGGYGAPPAPSAAAADGPPLRDPYAAHGGYGPAPSAMDPYAAHGSYGGHSAPAGSTVPSNVMEPYVPNSYPPPHGGYDGVHGDAMRHPYLGFGPAGSVLYHFGGEQYGGDPRVYGGGSASNQLPEYWSNIIRPNSKDATRKNVKRTAKVVQAARCQVCKIECTNKDGLDIHKQGKKHKKNLLKLQETITAKPVDEGDATVNKQKKKARAVSAEDFEKHKKNLLKLQETITAKPVDEGDATANKQKKKARAVSAEDFEAKRKRVLEAGAAAGEIKECKICNVIVNSQKVFDFHIRGQMHIAMVKQQATTV